MTKKDKRDVYVIADKEGIIAGVMLAESGAVVPAIFAQKTGAEHHLIHCPFKRHQFSIGQMTMTLTPKKDALITKNSRRITKTKKK